MKKNLVQPIYTLNLNLISIHSFSYHRFRVLPHFTSIHTNTCYIATKAERACGYLQIVRLIDPFVLTWKLANYCLIMVFIPFGEDRTWLDIRLALSLGLKELQVIICWEMGRILGDSEVEKMHSQKNIYSRSSITAAYQ